MAVRKAGRGQEEKSGTILALLKDAGDIKCMKTISLDLLAIQGNINQFIRAFRRQAAAEQWTQEEIDTVITECRAQGEDNTEHAVKTLIQVCKAPRD